MSSLNKIQSQESSTAKVAIARYSTFVNDLYIVFYFFADHEMGLGPRKTNKPVVECLLVGSPAQSALEKAVRVKALGEKQIP